jgi:predicted nucleotidyltransferase
MSRPSATTIVGSLRLDGAPAHAGPAGLPTSRLRAYLADIVDAGTTRGGSLVSLVLFGSAATGGYAPPISDIDLLLVVEDHADEAERRRIRDAVAELEVRHGFASFASFAKSKAGRRGALADALERLADRVTANVRAFFVCTRADLLSGDPGRILGLSRAQARFVDRVAIPSIVTSGVTVWGEDLLAAVPLPPIRRVDVAKAFFGLFNQVLLTAVVYPLLPKATKYAMDALKRSVHNCYFCHHVRSAPLAAEVAYFEERYGPDPVLARLLALRREYRPSFGFVLACLPALARLHLRTARDIRFPRLARTGAPPDER